MVSNDATQILNANGTAKLKVGFRFNCWENLQQVLPSSELVVICERSICSTLDACLISHGFFYITETMTGSSSDSVTPSEARIIKQIEYYFGDFNLSRNNFLKQKIQEDDGWVTIDSMLNFNRLKQLTDNAQMICEAVKKSSSGLMEVSEHEDKIRRSPSKPLPDDTKESREEINARTVFAKPFPLDVKLDDLLEFFEGYGQLDNVFMKRHFQKKTLKGSVLVTFSNKEDAAKFVNEEETKFKEQPLEVKCFKTKYFKRKEVIARTVYAKPFPLDVTLNNVHEFFEGYGQLDQVFMRRHFQNKTFKGSVFVTFDKEEDAAKFVNEEKTTFKEQALEVKCFQTDCFKHKAAQKKAKGKKNTDGKPHKRSADEAKEEETEADLEERVGQMMTKKTILHLKGLNSKSSREQVKAYISKHAVAAWVEFDQGATEDDIRLLEPLSTCSTQEKAKSASDGKAVLQRLQCPSEIEVRVVEGDEELQYWKIMFKDIAVNKNGGGRVRREGRRNQSRGQNQRDGQRNRGGPQNLNTIEEMDGGGSDGEEQGTEESPAKVINLEMVMTGPQVKRKQNKQETSSDEEEQDTKEPPAKVIKSELVITFQEILKFKDASSDGETEELEAEVNKSEMVVTGPQGKRNQTKNNASSDSAEQDTEEPPAKVIKSEMILKFQEVIKLEYALSDGVGQNTEEPPAKVAKFNTAITRPQGSNKQNKKHASSDGEKQDTEEPPASVIKSEMIITRSHSKRKQNKNQALSDGGDKNTEEPPAKFIRSEMIMTRSHGNEKRQKKTDASSDGEEQDTEEPPAKVNRFEEIMTMTAA
ncbi:hypothetical protein BsWGS_00875 [Bradybaena similaris]